MRKCSTCGTGLTRCWCIKCKEEIEDQKPHACSMGGMTARLGAGSGILAFRKLEIENRSQHIVNPISAEVTEEMAPVSFAVTYLMVR